MTTSSLYPAGGMLVATKQGQWKNSNKKHPRFGGKCKNAIGRGTLLGGLSGCLLGCPSLGGGALRSRIKHLLTHWDRGLVFILYGGGAGLRASERTLTLEKSNLYTLPTGCWGVAERRKVRGKISCIFEGYQYLFHCYIPWAPLIARYKWDSQHF